MSMKRNLILATLVAVPAYFYFTMSQRDKRRAKDTAREAFNTGMTPSMMNKVADTASNVGSKANEMAARMGNKAEGTTSDMTKKASEMAANVGSRSEQMASNMRDQASQKIQDRNK
mgnify:CR=1 FL=1